MYKLTTVTALSVLAIATTITPALAEKLRLACPSAATSSTCLTAEHFAKEATEKSGGKLNIQVFPGGQLGSGEAAIQQMRAGVLDLVVEDISNFGNFVKDYNVVSWGFTFRNEKHFLDFLSSDIEKAMAKKLADEQGIQVIANDWRKLPRVVVASKPVEKPEDLAGMKFRVPAIPSYIATWQTLGANPTQIPWSDAFQALKTGTVDGMESPLDSVKSQKFDLAAPYVSLTDHVFSSLVLAMNETRWSKLTPDEQAILKTAAENAAAYSAELANKASSDVIDQIKADGAKIITPDRKLFADKLHAAALDEEKKGLWGEGLYEKIQALQ